MKRLSPFGTLLTREGINIVTYYAPTLFQASLNFSAQMALLMGCFLQVWYILASFVTWYTIDRVGRVVIPKALRVALGITPDTQLELIPNGSGLRIEPVTRHQRLIETSDGLPVLGNVEGAVLTFASDGYLSEPFGADSVHRGADERVRSRRLTSR